MVWYSYLFQNVPQFIVIHTIKGFDMVNKAEADVFLQLSCFFHDPTDVGNLISGSSPFSKCSLNIWKFMFHILLKPGLEFEHSLALPFFGIGMKTDLFQSCATAEFSKFAGILSVALSQHHLSGFETAQLEFHHLH